MFCPFNSWYISKSSVVTIVMASNASNRLNKLNLLACMLYSRSRLLSITLSIIHYHIDMLLVHLASATGIQLILAILVRLCLQFEAKQ